MFTAVNCTDPLPGIVNGTLVVNGTSYNSTAEFICNDGFHFGDLNNFTSKVARCDENADWTITQDQTCTCELHRVLRG